MRKEIQAVIDKSKRAIAEEVFKVISDYLKKRVHESPK